MYWNYVVVFFLVAFSTVTARDFEVWLLSNFSKEISTSWEIEAHVASRFREDAHRAYLYYAELGLTRVLPHQLEITPGCRYTYSRSSTGQWRGHPSPFISVTKSWEFFGWIFSNRNRFAYLSRPKIWRFRQRFLCEFPWKVPFVNWTPYVFDEWFFSERIGLSQNRFLMGVKTNFSEYQGLSLAYLLRQVKSNENWDGTNILYCTFWMQF